MADGEYDEVDAVVRIPKGERLADSKKTDGWSRGFTPKTSDKGPEHVEIRLKSESELDDEPEVVYVTEYVFDRQSQLTPGQQIVADFMQQVIDGLIEIGKPVFAHWWETQAVPAIAAKRESFRQKRQDRRAQKRALRAAEMPSADALVVEAEPSTQEMGIALSARKVTVTGEQFQQMFLAWLAREYAQQALWYLIVNAEVEDGDVATLAWQQELKELAPEQRTGRVMEFFAANRAMLEDFARQVMGGLTLAAGESRFVQEHPPDSCHMSAISGFLCCLCWSGLGCRCD